MRTVLVFVAMLGLFLAGHAFEAHLVIATGVLGACMILAAFCYASAETHGFEGLHVEAPEQPYCWQDIFLDVARLGMHRDSLVGAEPVYVVCNEGVIPIYGIFSARVNGTMSIVFDTAAPTHPAENFNRLKQGVM